MSWDIPTKVDGALGPWYDAAQRAVATSGYFVERHRPAGTRYHRQPGFEISVALAGRAVVLTGDAAPTLHAAGSIVVIAPQCPHQLICEPVVGFERIVLCVDIERLVAVGHSRSQFPADWVPRDRILCLRPAKAESARCVDLARQLLRETQFHGLAWDACSIALISQFLVHLARLSPEAVGPTVNRRGGQAALVERAVAYVSSRLSERIALTDIAGVLGVSPEHLTRSFRVVLGLPFHQYLLLERIASAKRLLTERADLTITDVAFEVGFSSSSEFTRAFRRATGATPTTHRRETAHLA